jgi:hypothetical protein
MFKPKTLRDAIELARVRDENLSKTRKNPRGEGPRLPYTSFMQRSTGHAAATMGQTATTSSVSTSRTYSSGAANKLSWEEMRKRKRKEKGLCFWCNEKFTPEHRCQKPQTFLIEAYTTEEDDELVDFTGASEGGNCAEEEEPLISLHAIAGCNGPKTMRVKTAIERRILVILIDSGSTHNFVDHKIAHVLQLAVTPTEEFTVKVANGEKLRCTERYANVVISIQGFQFSTTLYSLPLHGIDIVLGIQWLENLGPVLCD